MTLHTVTTEYCCLLFTPNYFTVTKVLHAVAWPAGTHLDNVLFKFDVSISSLTVLANDAVNIIHLLKLSLTNIG